MCGTLVRALMFGMIGAVGSRITQTQSHSIAAAPSVPWRILCVEAGGQFDEAQLGIAVSTAVD